MKKILLTLLILLTFSTSAFADKPEKFCYDGMCLDGKGWLLSSTKEGNKSVITGIKMIAKELKGMFFIERFKPTEPISIEDYVQKRFNEHLASEKYSTVLENIISAAIEEEPFIINNLKAKVFYSQTNNQQGEKINYQRVFFFEKDNYYYEIKTISYFSTKEHTELFLNILNSFTIVTVDVKGVVINGVKWATSNVGIPAGILVTSPNNYGELFSWDEAQNVCPTGWRLPTQIEFQSLVDAGSEQKKINKVSGCVFGSGNNSIFLPAAGSRDIFCKDDKMPTRDVIGEYWSSTLNDDNSVHMLFFITGSKNNEMVSSDFTIARSGRRLSVRCVAD